MSDVLRSRKFIAAAATMIGVAVVLAVVVVRVGFVKSGRIARGACVVGVELGGLAPDEARAKLRWWSRERGSTMLTFVANGRSWSGKLVDVGVVPDVPAMERWARSIGREGNVVRRVMEEFGLSPRGRNLPPVYKFDPDKIAEVFAKIDRTVAQPPRDARIRFVDGVREITPEALGTSVDSSRSYELVRSAVILGRSQVDLPILPKAASVTIADLEKVDTLLASFTTIYPAWRKGRTHNIKLAVRAIDGDLIKPGQVFSYNTAVGPRLREYGFQDAPIYFNGKIIPGTGGGICQVSSTVYNTALLAGLRITERSHHSMKVPYVPLGRDATVAYGLLDLKFENNTSAPIYIAANSARSRLTVAIYGASGAKKHVRIVTTRPKRFQRGNGKTVTAVTVYRVLSENGVDVSRERVSSDRYNPAPPHAAVTAKPRQG